MTAPAQPQADPGQAPAGAPAGQEVGAPDAPAETPPWGTDFDAERAWKLVQNLRADKERAAQERDTFRQKATEYETAQMTEAEKAAAALAEAQKTAETSTTEVLRLRALVKHGLDEEDLDLLGSGTAEEIDARAARLAARSSAPKTPAGRKPQERLRGGGDPDVEPAVDPIRAADQIRARNRY